MKVKYRDRHPEEPMVAEVSVDKTARLALENRRLAVENPAGGEVFPVRPSIFNCPGKYPSIRRRSKTMKDHMVKTAMIVGLMLMAACAGMKSFQHDEKYNLDDQLEVVTEIHKYTMRGWETVDRQSFVLRTGPGTYYLIVLTGLSTELMFTESLKVSNSGATVKAGFDRVTVYQSGRGVDYVIHKIYKFRDYEQVREIRAQLTGK